MREIYCSKCHSETFEGNAFCPYCGQLFHSIPEMGIVNDKWPEDRIDNFLVTDIGYYVGNNREKYLKNLKKVSNKKLTFNWAACFLTFYWYLYRRMIREFFIVTGISYAVGLIFCVIMALLMYKGGIVTFVICYIIMLFAPYFAFGATAYPLYFSKVKRELKRYNCENRPAMRNDELATMLGKQGGTKASNIFIFIGATFGVTMLITIFITIITLAIAAGLS